MFKPFAWLIASTLWMGSVSAGPEARSSVAAATTEKRADIQTLDQHFSSAGTDDLGPWQFMPEDQIERVTTSEHPGLAAIYPAKNASRDIKGVLRDPIRIGDYPLPWQFQCSFMQNFDLMTGRTPTQANYAVGVNIAVTFSDPSTWPADRSQRPADTRELQLFVVHLGNYGEVGKGLPQLLTEVNNTPEQYYVVGRGDLAGPARGNWKIPTILIGDGARYGGPASNQLYFRVSVESPTHLTVAIKFDPSHGWNIRHVDLEKFGKITGIWEIGPIISGDRWIPDVLAPELGIKPPPAVEKPALQLPAYLDYCVFMGAAPPLLEHLSDDFDIPGYLGKWQIQEQSTIVENWSQPGWLAVHLLGPDMGTCFGAAGVVNLPLSVYRPPWEIEMAVTPPDVQYPWVFFFNFGLYDAPYEDPHWLKLIGKPVPAKQGNLLGWWTPGIESLGDGDVHPSKTAGRMANPIDMEWDPPVPTEILSVKPVYMLIQVIDADHLRMGFRASPTEPWHLSKVKNTRPILGKPIGQLGPHHALSFMTGPGWGGKHGLPAYSQFSFDYIRYRYGLSAK